MIKLPFTVNFLLTVSFVASIIPVSTLAGQGLNILPKDFKPQEKTVLKVSNMPRVRSQDTVGICYSFVAASLIDEANCSSLKVPDCGSVPDTKKVSPLDISRFNQTLGEDADKTDRFNYEGLAVKGGETAFTLQNAINTGAIVQESCAPFDQLVSSISDPVKAQEMELATWKRFEDSYNTYQKKSKACIDCGLEYATAVSKQLKEEFNLKSSNKEILEAFAQDSYGKFLDKLLIQDKCWDLRNLTSLEGRWDQKAFPTSNAKTNYEGYISKIKEVLGKKRPIGIEFCTQTPLVAKDPKSCGNMKDGKLVSGEGHALIIKGYRKVCNEKNECRDALQVQNSWGESWQNANDDGWVDAKELISRTFYEAQSMTWLEPRTE